MGNNLLVDATLEEDSSPEAPEVADEMLELELLAIVGRGPLPAYV
jgi:hypothetical protein